jgi:NTE family protein
VSPPRGLARRTIDAASILGGIVRPGKTIGHNVARSVPQAPRRRRHCRMLPDRPRFVLNATIVQNGSLWWFSKPLVAAAGCPC